MENRRPHLVIANGGVHRCAVGSVRRTPLRKLTSRSVRAPAVVCARTRDLMPSAGAADRRRDRRFHQPGRRHPSARGWRQQGGRVRHRLDLRHHSCGLLMHGAAAVRRPLQARRRPRPGDRLPLFRSGDQHPRHRADGEGAGLRVGCSAGDRRCFFLDDHRPGDGDPLSPRSAGTKRLGRWRRDGAAGGWLRLSDRRGRRLVRADDHLSRLRQLGEGGSARQRLLARCLRMEMVAGEPERRRCRVGTVPRPGVRLVADRAGRGTRRDTGGRPARATPVRHRRWVAGLCAVAAMQPGAGQEWFEQTWGFAKLILPLLLLGVLAAGFLLGQPGQEGLLPSAWVAAAVGGNSLASNAFAAIAGAFMYFATLTEIPITQALIGAGMGKGPALALLLAGPALSLPSMLVIRGFLGTQKTLVYVSLVVVMATITGMVYGTYWG